MDLRKGTKTPGERENEEVERLVRPSPKVKPPRHDLRRERVEVDSDPDLDTADKDLSKNFKDIGGSVVERVAARWSEQASVGVAEDLFDVRLALARDSRRSKSSKRSLSKAPVKKAPSKAPRPSSKPPSKKVAPSKAVPKKAPPSSATTARPKIPSRSPAKAPLRAPSSKPGTKSAPPSSKVPAQKAPSKAPTSKVPGKAPGAAKPSTPKQPWSKADTKVVKVRSKSTQKIRWIQQQTLKENPGEYELVRPGEDVPKKAPKAPEQLGLPLPPAEPRPDAKKPDPEAPKVQDKQAPKKPDEGGADPATADAAALEKRDRAALKELRALAKGDESFAALLRAFKTKGDVTEFVKNTPNFPAAKFMQNKKLPEGVKTVGDVARIVNLPPAVKTLPGADPAQSVAPQPQVQQVQPGQPQPKTDEPPGGKAQPSQEPAKPKYEAPKQEDPKDRELRNKTTEFLKANPHIAPVLKELGKSKSKVFQDAKAHPDFSADDYFAELLNGAKFPPGASTLKDLQRVLALPSKAPAPSMVPPTEQPVAPAQPAVTPGEQPAPDAAAPVSPSSDPAAVQAPVDPAVAPAPAAGGPAQPPAKPTGEKKDRLKKDPGGKKKTWGQTDDPWAKAPEYVSGQPERAVSSSERDEAIRHINRAFPPNLAAGLLTATPPYHPDEVQDLIRDYNAAKSLPANDVGKLIGQTQRFYATDASKVRPPKFAMNEAGEKVPLGELPPAEQARAIRKHQVQAVAMSLGARSAVSSRFENHGVPPELSHTISDFMLAEKGSPARRSKQAQQAADKIFTDGISPDPTAAPLSDDDVKNLLSISDDPAVKKLVVGHCQANDYQEARNMFLGRAAEHPIDERQSPNEIADGLAKAAKFLRDRTARYGDGGATHDTAAMFRRRVMKQLNALDPKKADQVQSLLEAEDNRHYEEQWSKHEMAVEAYQQKREEAEGNYAQDYKAYSERLKNGGDPDEAPPANVDDRLAEAGVDRPKPPTKPAHYDKQTKKPEQMGATAQELWEQFQSRFASTGGLIRRVAARGSIYSATCAMDRTAVYWGVDPYPPGKEGPEPYGGWQQPQARDLGDSDFTKILKAARTWLKQPVLSEDIDGVVRDTQLRAALDLALRDENYESAVHPAIYNKLLARLAGVSEDETLLTVRSKTARNTMSKKVELETARADRLLAGLDRIASVVQSNYQQWGMDMRAAKNLVNAIDKIADDLEVSTYGERSLLNRQTQEIGHAKLAQVLQKESDEKYMSTFDNPMSPHQTEADEPYMKAYKDDQSSAVRKGKSSNGRALAP